MTQDAACCVWDLTIPVEKITVENLILRFKNDCKKWAFQKEKGNETGYIHYQCRISLKVKERMTPVINRYRDLSAHVTRTASVNTTNAFYVLKDDTRIEGPWKDDDPNIPKQYKNIPNGGWYKWQQNVIDEIATEPDTRTINTIVDSEGAHGKSYISNYLACRGIARKLPPLNDYRDLMRMVMDTPDSRCYFIDIPRALDKSKLKNFYGAIEDIKNGYAFDDRYRFQEKYFDTPHIFVFTNCEPDYNLLTKDRWKRWTITKDK